MLEILISYMMRLLSGAVFVLILITQLNISGMNNYETKVTGLLE